MKFFICPYVKGGALQCAMMSVRMKVKPFNMVDKLPYGLIVHYDLQKEVRQIFLD
jgi:hypothetical protein